MACAAVSVIVVSLTGIAALTGLLPTLHATAVQPMSMTLKAPAASPLAGPLAPVGQQVANHRPYKTTPTSPKPSQKPSLITLSTRQPNVARSIPRRRLIKRPLQAIRPPRRLRRPTARLALAWAPWSAACWATRSPSAIRKVRASSHSAQGPGARALRYWSCPFKIGIGFPLQ